MGAKRKKSKKRFGTKAEQLLENATFFVDRCLGRHVEITLRAAGLKVQFHDDHFTDDTQDVDWYDTVAANGWIALTKDKEMRRVELEREAIIACKLRMFTLPSGNLRGDQMAQIFLDNRLRMARFIRQHAAGFIAVVSKGGISLAFPKPAGKQGR
jgi:predicted nuclease of predicted toxin-antitoxin system